MKKLFCEYFSLWLNSEQNIENKYNLYIKFFTKKNQLTNYISYVTIRSNKLPHISKTNKDRRLLFVVYCRSFDNILLGSHFREQAFPMNPHLIFKDLQYKTNSILLYLFVLEIWGNLLDLRETEINISL